MSKDIFSLLDLSLKETAALSSFTSLINLLQEAIKPEPDFNTINQLVSADPALSATILFLVNSAYYGLPERVTNLKRAIILLGLKEILKIIISVYLCQHLKQNHPKYEANLWPILFSAVASEILASKVKSNGLSPEKCYLNALLKDLSLLLLCQLPKTDQMQDFCQEQNFILLKPNQLQKEKQLWGTTHPELTLYVLSKWSSALAQEFTCIRHHHDLESIAEYNLETQILILSTLWAEAEFTPQDSTKLLRLQELMFLTLRLDVNQVEKIRSGLKDKFAQLCTSLQLKTCSLPNLLSTSLDRIQNYYLLLQSISTCTQLKDVVKNIATHLYWLFNLKRFYLALPSPLTQETICYKINAGQIEQINPKECSFKKSSQKNCFKLELTLLTEHTGCICIPQINSKYQAELKLYLNLLSKVYTNFFQSYLEKQAKTILVDMLPLGVIHINSKGEVIQLNEYAKNLFQLKQKCFGVSFKRLIKNLGIELGAEWDDFLAQEKDTYSKLFCNVSPLKDQAKNICFNLSARWYTLDQSSQVIVTINDITEIVDFTNELIYQQNFLNQLLSSMQDVVLIVNQTGKIIFTSPQLTSLKNKNLFEISTACISSSLDWQASSLQALKDPVEVKIDLGTQVMRLEILISKLGSNQYLIVGRDLSRIRRIEDKIRKRALFDHLSQVYNRHQFTHLLAKMVERSKRTQENLGLIFFDLDKFKVYNDTYGHQQGDKIIVNFGQILRNLSRKGLDFPCRYGGDEFVLLSTKVNKTSLQTIASRIKKKFDQIYQKQVTLSIGLTLFRSEDSAESFLNRADQAAYEAKRLGGDRIVWK